MGRPCGRCAGVPAIFERYFGSKYDSEVLAVGGRHPLPALDSIITAVDSGAC